MADNIDVLTTYEKNGITYRGSFPLFVSSIDCDTGAEASFQEDLTNSLQLISEEPNE